MVKRIGDSKNSMSDLVLRIVEAACDLRLCSDPAQIGKLEGRLYVAVDAYRAVVHEVSNHQKNGGQAC